LGFAVVFILNLQGVENLGGFFGVCCVVYFKSLRCCETLEVFFDAAVFILTLQGVVKPWRFLCCCVVYFKSLRCCETLEVAAVLWCLF